MNLARVAVSENTRSVVAKTPNNNKNCHSVSSFFRARFMSVREINMQKIIVFTLGVVTAVIVLCRSTYEIF